MPDGLGIQLMQSLGDAQGERILREFHTLGEDDRTVGFALAWLLEPLPMTALANRMAKAQIRTHSGKRFANQRVREALRKLADLGLAEARDGGPYQIDPVVSHYLVADLAQDPERLEQFRNLPLSDYEHFSRMGRFFHYSEDSTGILRAVRDLRNTFHRGDEDELESTYEQVHSMLPETQLWSFVLHPFQPEKVGKLPGNLFYSAIDCCLLGLIDEFQPACAVLSLAEERADNPSELWSICEVALLTGDWETVGRLRDRLDKDESPMGGVMAAEVAGSEAFLRGRNDEALACFAESMALWRKATRKRNLCPGGLMGVWFLAALLRRGRPEDLAAVRKHAKWGQELHEIRGRHFSAMAELAESLTGQESPHLAGELALHSGGWLRNSRPGFTDLLFFALVRSLIPERLEKDECLAALERLRSTAENNGARWVAAEASALHDAWQGGSSAPVSQRSTDLQSCFGPEASPFFVSLSPPEPWEKTLLALETLGHERAGKGRKKTTTRGKAAARKQLVWHLDVHDYGWELTPIERTISAGGKVSKGRRVSLKRLKETAADIPHLTEQDRAVAARVRRHQGWSGYNEYELCNPKALLDLAGHPLLFADAAARLPLELVRVSPRLVLTESKQGKVRLTLEPKAGYTKPEPELIVESPTRMLVLETSAVHVKVHDLLGQRGTELPAESKGRVIEALGNLAGELAVESDEAALGATEVATVPAAELPVLRLCPQGEGLQARLLVRPIPGVELTYPPGEGKAVVFANLDGRPVKALRALKREGKAAGEILENCPALEEFGGLAGDPWTAEFEEPMHCLGLLAELHLLGPEKVSVEWPEGQPIRLRAVADPSRFELSLGGGQEWLSASGALTVDDELVLSMRQLLELAGGSSGTPGFVQLDDGQFLALTEELRRQLEDLRAFSQPGKGEKLRIHPLAALSLDDLAGRAGVKVGAAWKRQLKKLRLDPAIESLQPPSTLQAELRPYQLDGFRWLMRLAGWGMGACLADDMGLGKTVQALAMLLERAADGPALVVAPTSVAANWLEETIRFAPTLKPVLFGRQGQGEDREAVLKNAAAFDLVITSYGLLQSENEAFAAVPWHSVILDEAQAIKNRQTKRSQAAMKLQAGFRVVTTGTPVENRLSELHNLFSFINPGLLGSWERFRTSFADPIERHQDDAARDRLRRLIRPFILRRVKSAVLRDLPSKTEVALHVEMTPEEAAFYEALRQKAVDDLDQAAEQSAAPGRAAIRILAELMRLRRACCHPKLIDPKTSLASSKLRVFAETLDEILEGRHKVLVFSQFVDHLKLIREHLDQQEISYQYLDGSTPVGKRQKAVTDFQSGRGEVFLISLKAGGFGLNLTAADYVIHMDPWWNPAAEDQASDRAHRIGQTRPVTIYRLITTGTIEEKIVDLHHRKRELADSILAGTDSGTRLSPDELLELLRS